MLLKNVARCVDLLKYDVIGPEECEMLQHQLGVAFLQQRAIEHIMAPNKPAISRQVDIDNLDIWIGVADLILARQLAPHAPVAALVVYRVHPDPGFFVRIVVDVEHDRQAVKRHGNFGRPACSGPSRSAYATLLALRVDSTWSL
jgi:hypothetical protein